MLHGNVYFTTLFFISISYVSSVTTSSFRNRLLLMSADLGAVLDITMSINVSDRLLIARIAEEFNRVGNDGLVGVFMSSASSCGNRLTKPSIAGVMFILDDLVLSIHHESEHKVPL